MPAALEVAPTQNLQDCMYCDRPAGFGQWPAALILWAFSPGDERTSGRRDMHHAGPRGCRSGRSRGWGSVGRGCRAGIHRQLVAELAGEGLRHPGASVLGPPVELAQRVGIQLRYEEGGGPRRSEEPGKRQRIIEANRTAAQFYAEHILVKAPGLRDSIVEGANSVTDLALEAF